MSVHACVASLRCALSRQGIFISFSLLHQSYHECKEVENNSASVPLKEEVRTQVLISSIFFDDLVPFLRDQAWILKISVILLEEKKPP